MIRLNDFMYGFVVAGAASLLLSLNVFQSGARELKLDQVPRAYKWTDNREVVFTYDGTYTDDRAFSLNVKGMKVRKGIKAPEKYTEFPDVLKGKPVNPTYSPDSTMIAYTRQDNNLYVLDIASGRETRLTDDGTELIKNGYASWVYYEEILGRPSKYRAFWWSPDSGKIGFYRFDDTLVPMFPIYSPFGQDGNLIRTHYPKAGERNPEVRIGIVDVSAAVSGASHTVWADFDPSDDQYFGIPFWGADSENIFISREPRLQNTLDIFSVSVHDGGKTHIYHEYYPTWLDWCEGMVFTSEGLYMARSFETGWEQIYFLSYDGKTFRRLTDGQNWRVNILTADEKSGKVIFTANRDATTRACLYSVDSKGLVTALTDTSLNVANVVLSPDSRHFVATVSNFTTPDKVILGSTSPKVAKSDIKTVYGSLSAYPSLSGSTSVVADADGGTFESESWCLPSMIYLTTRDGFRLPGFIIYPHNFDPHRKYPVHVDIYGGPDTPMVRDRWYHPSRWGWYAQNDIIEVTVDCRAAGHNGRAGMDMIYRQLSKTEVMDFVEWGQYLASLPYVNPLKIGVEGFSFGGTMTALLVMDHSDVFHYGIAGGGVYDWSLYDTHYTERFMDTPQANPDGYEYNKVINHVVNYPLSVLDPSVMKDKSDFQGDISSYDCAEKNAVEPVMLKLTHGTGDDNVHFQNTLQLIDRMQTSYRKFDFMIYPDGLHGYRGKQGVHDLYLNYAFWKKYLCTVNE